MSIHIVAKAHVRPIPHVRHVSAPQPQTQLADQVVPEPRHRTTVRPRMYGDQMMFVPERQDEAPRPNPIAAFFDWLFG